MSSLRWFRWGTYLMIAFLVTHIITGYSGLKIPTPTPQAQELVHLINTVKVRYFDSWPERRVVDTLDGFMFQWGAMLLFVILLNLAVARASVPKAPTPFIRWTNTVIWTGCLVSCLLFWSLPQILFFALIALCFLVSCCAPEAQE